MYIKVPHAVHRNFAGLAKFLQGRQDGSQGRRGLSSAVGFLAHAFANALSSAPRVPRFIQR